MRHRGVQDVMTKDVVTVESDTPYKQIAEILAEHKISGVPVVDSDAHVLGVVSEADLLAKAEYPEAERRRRRLLDRPGTSQARRRASAGLARDLMTAPAVTIDDRTSIVRAAKEMDRHQVKRLPVVDELGRLVGIVSRRDMLKVFLRSDDDIRAEVETDVLDQSLSIRPSAVSVTVVDGVVTLDGTVDRKCLIPIAARLTKAVDGVVDVVERLDYSFDDETAIEVTYDDRPPDRMG
jgi:CBS domain-containing protein